MLKFLKQDCSERNQRDVVGIHDNCCMVLPRQGSPYSPTLTKVALCNDSELLFGASICSFSRFQIKIYSHCCNCLKTCAKFYRGFIAKDR